MSAGPFETRAQAQAVPAVRAAFADAQQRTPGVLGEHSRAMLYAALTGSGVELGDFDRRIVDWLTSVGEPHVIAVIAGWITRAGGER